jgi:VanZ family protein
VANFVLYGSVLAGLAFQSRRAGVIAAFAVVLSMHLLAGVAEYRKTMRRPWPDVAPLTDDDEE